MTIKEPATFSEALELSDSLQGYIYRGHRVFDWNLETSVERNEKRRRKIAIPVQNLEREIIYHYRRTAHQYLRRVPADSDTVEWLSVLQHYGAPTRFLDFSKSFWIALFFAVEDADSDCAIWAAPTSRFCSKNGINLNKEVGEDVGVDPYPLAKKNDDIFCDEPYYMHERLVAQRAVFVFTIGDSGLQASLEKSLDQDLLKIRIAKSWFPEIWKRLREMNINSSVLFPGIDGFSRRFKNDWT